LLRLLAFEHFAMHHIFKFVLVSQRLLTTLRIITLVVGGVVSSAAKKKKKKKKKQQQQIHIIRRAIGIESACKSQSKLITNFKRIDFLHSDERERVS
jgi:hypothetical protein